MPSQQEMDFNTSLRHNVTDLMTKATTSFSVNTHKSGPFSVFTKRHKQNAQTSIANYNVSSNRVLTHTAQSSTLYTIQYMTESTQKRDTLDNVTSVIDTTRAHNVTTPIDTTRSRNAQYG
ncbi:uncharacterized protein LOC134281449 [Saccostrea cucullata]|uniref:uncharacterized protein LOC134265866 n=1 Tax=Saccostrea cuccullata TaxID=36930 RepID=UPI002ED253EA